METGTYISGLAHVAILGWAALGGILSGPDPAPEFQITEVSILSESEFAALISDAPTPESGVAATLAVPSSVVSQSISRSSSA